MMKTGGVYEKQLILMHSSMKQLSFPYIAEQLRTLSISYSQIQSLQFLQFTPQLQELYADCCHLDVCEQIRYCQNLKIFVARCNNFEAIPSHANVQIVDVLGNQQQISELPDLPSIRSFYIDRNPFDLIDCSFCLGYNENDNIYYQNYQSTKLSLQFNDETQKLEVQSNGEIEIKINIYSVIENIGICEVYSKNTTTKLANQLFLGSFLQIRPSYSYPYEDEIIRAIQSIKQRRSHKLLKQKQFQLLQVQFLKKTILFCISSASGQLIDYIKVRNKYNLKANQQVMQQEHQESMQEAASKSFEVQELVCKKEVVRRPQKPQKKGAQRPAREQQNVVQQTPEITEHDSKVVELEYERQDPPLTIVVRGQPLTGEQMQATQPEGCQIEGAYVSQLDKQQIAEELLSRYNIREEQVLLDSLLSYNGCNEESANELRLAQLELYSQRYELQLERLGTKAAGAFTVPENAYNRLLFLVIRAGGRLYHYAVPEYISKTVSVTSVRLEQKDNFLQATAYTIQQQMPQRFEDSNLVYQFYRNNLIIQEGKQPFCVINDQLGRYKCKCQVVGQSGQPLSNEVFSNQVHVKEPARGGSDRNMPAMQSTQPAKSPLLSAPSSKLQQNYHYCQVTDDASFDNLDNTTTENEITDATPTARKSDQLSSLKPNMSIQMFNYTIQQSDTMYGELQQIKRLYCGLDTKLKLIFVRNQLKENRQIMQLGRQPLREPFQHYFGQTYLEYNTIMLDQPARLQDYSFSFDVQLLFQYSQYLEALSADGGTAQFVVSRDQNGGWVFAILSSSGKVTALLPLCRSYQLLTYQSYKQQVTDDVLNVQLARQEGETFVLSVEDVIIPFTAPPATAASLNQTFLIAYSEVVGQFSRYSASSLNYNALVVHRFACISAYQRLFEKAFGLDAEGEQPLLDVCARYEQETNQFLRQLLVLKCVLKHLNALTQNDQFEAQALQLLQEGAEFGENLLCALFQYPVLKNYEAFKSVQFAAPLYITTQLKVSQKLISQPLPLELQRLATQYQRKKDDTMPSILSVFACFASDVKLNKTICQYGQFSIDVDDQEFAVFTAFLPEYINSESADMLQISRLLPLEYYALLYKIRKLADDTNKQVKFVNVSSHCAQSGEKTVIFTLLESDAQASTEATQGLCQVYGEMDYQLLNHYSLNYNAQQHYFVLIKLVMSTTGKQMAYTLKSTGLPFIKAFQSRQEANLKLFQLYSGYSANERRVSLGNATLLFTDSSLDQDPEYQLQDACTVGLKLKRIFSPQEYTQLQASIAKQQVFTYNIHQIEEENAHEFDQEKSMSDEEDNIHPYRGRVNEMCLENEELQAALEDYYSRDSQAENILANWKVFQSQVVGFLYNEEHYDANEFQRILKPNEQYSFEAPMRLQNLEHLRDEQQYCCVESIPQQFQSFDFWEWDVIELK